MRWLLLCSVLALPLSAQVQCLGSWLCIGTADEINALTPRENTIAIIPDASNGKECPPVGGGVEVAQCIYRSGAWVPFLSDVQGDSSEPTNLETVDDHIPPTAPTLEAASDWWIDRAAGELCYVRQIDGSTRCLGWDYPRSYEPVACSSTFYGRRYFDLEDAKLCVCANDGTDDAWVKSDAYDHADHCSSSPPAVPATNLVAHIGFTETSGQQAADSSGNANDGQFGSTAGTDENDPTWGVYAANFPTSASVEHYITLPDLGVIYSFDMLFYLPHVLNGSCNPAITLIDGIAGTANRLRFRVGNVFGTIGNEELFTVTSGSGSSYIGVDDSGTVSAGWHIFQANWNAVNANYDVYLNGTQYTTRTQGTPALPTADATGPKLGGDIRATTGCTTSSVDWRIADFTAYSAARADNDLDTAGQAIVAAKPGLKITAYSFTALP